MKYGIAFALLAGLFVIYAVCTAGWFYLLLWPAFSFGLLAIAYLGTGVSIFGKRPDGTLPFVRLLLLAPFLVNLTLVWHLVRYISKEPAFHQLTENVFIGRRLLAHELPSNVKYVVDLTCEFNEPREIRNSAGYISFPILDGHSADESEFLRMVSKVAELDGSIFIHCAQGHGRTATFAIAYLIHKGISATVNDGVDYVLKCRPEAKQNRTQRAMLDGIYGSGSRTEFPHGTTNTPDISSFKSR